MHSASSKPPLYCSSCRLYVPSTHSCPSRQCEAHSVLQETVKSSSHPTCNYAKAKRRFLPPMFLHTSAQSDLLSDLCTHRVGEDDLGKISLDGADAAACRQRADVHHQHLVLRQLLDLQTRTKITTMFKIFCCREITFLHLHSGYRSHSLLFYPKDFKLHFP